LSQLAQALVRNLSLKFKETVREKLKFQLPQLQRKWLFYNHRNTNTEQTPILQI
jgi:hypothetical protein